MNKSFEAESEYLYQKKIGELQAELKLQDQANDILDRMVKELQAEVKKYREALKRECCCPGERDYNGKEILCEPCEALKSGTVGE
jgi:hypothetical protein